MDDNGQRSLPQSIVIDTPQNQTDAALANTPVLSGTATTYVAQQPIIIVDDSPPYKLLWTSLILIFLSTLFPFLVTDMDFGINLDDIMCFVLCNGNATGLILLGTFSVKFASWKKRHGGSLIAGISVLSAIFSFGVAALFLFLYSIFAADEYFNF